jgi:glycosyltransferase involved in cell wall biosynthesis
MITSGQGTAETDRNPIYIEVSPLLSKQLTGVGRLAARLVQALAPCVPVRLVTTMQRADVRRLGVATGLACGQEIAVPRADLPGADADLEAWVGRLLRLPPQPHDLAQASRSTILFTILRPAFRHFRRELCYLHDFTPLLLPWAHRPETREHFGAFFAQSSRLCDKLVANSRSTQADARWLCAVPPEDVVLGHPGPTVCVQAHAHLGPVPRLDHMALVVSTLEPRKNGPFLLDWFLNTTVLDARMELCWVGPTGWWAPQEWLNDLFRRGKRRAARGRRVRFLGMVSDRRLCQLYRQAKFTIYPSLYEGFGFPVLDSLLHETPVLSSFHSSLQEFAGSGVHYFDPHDPDSLDQACRELFEAPPAAIDHDGLRRRFSWDALAQTVLSLSA